MTINRVIECGRFTANPELSYTQNNVPVCRFTLAVDRYNGEGKDNTADFIPCTAWSGTAEFISKYFFKGKKAIVEGNLRTFTWTDKDNQTRYGWEVVIEKIDFADDKKAENQQNQNPPQQYQQQPQQNYNQNPPSNQNPPQNQQNRQSNQGGYRAPQGPPPQNTQQQQPQYPWEKQN